MCLSDQGGIELEICTDNGKLLKMKKMRTHALRNILRSKSTAPLPRPLDFWLFVTRGLEPPGFPPPRFGCLITFIVGRI